jgi:predicted DNA-binding transcriptional regulator YafY
MHGGDIGCIAHEVVRDATAVFALDRMSDVQASEEEYYDLPTEFVIEEWLQGDFGVARAPRSVRLLVEFDARVADAIRGRRVHPSQKVAVAQDGRIRASLLVPDTAEVAARVRAWLLSFGSAARVLEPRELADDMAAELKRGAARYE